MINNVLLAEEDVTSSENIVFSHEKMWLKNQVEIFEFQNLFSTYFHLKT
jgi:hypothetical protein